MSKLSAYLSNEKREFLLAAQERGGTAPGFRALIGKRYDADRDHFNKMVLDAFLESATRVWERQPRKRGPDLFTVNGYVIPEFLTRPGSQFDNDDEDHAEIDDENEGEPDDTSEQFEKVAQQFATINDLLADALIKMRKAAQSGAAAERQMRAVDDARRRARGDMTAFIVNVADSTRASRAPASPSPPFVPGQAAP